VHSRCDGGVRLAIAFHSVDQEARSDPAGNLIEYVYFH
jgi:hypothetical protein